LHSKKNTITEGTHTKKYKELKFDSESFYSNKKYELMKREIIKDRRIMTLFFFCQNFKQHTYKVNHKTRTNKEMLFFFKVIHIKIYLGRTTIITTIKGIQEMFSKNNCKVTE
jgi:hypothetical protein